MTQSCASSIQLRGLENSSNECCPLVPDILNLEIRCLSKLHKVCMDLLFKLLGWAIAGDKEVQFGSIAKVLWLKIDSAKPRCS